MSDFDSRQEIEKAQSRIDQIRHRKAMGQPPAAAERTFDGSYTADSGYADEGLGAINSPGVSRTRARTTEMIQEAAPVTAPRKSAQGSGSNAMRFLLGLVGIAIAIVLILFLLSSFFRGGGQVLPFSLFGTDTPTPMPTETATPLPTETPLPTATPLPPALSMPPLTCIFQSGTGCLDYCTDPLNAGECQAAKNFIAAQGADPEFWLNCVSPATGPNTGNPQQCLVDAYYAFQNQN